MYLDASQMEAPSEYDVSNLLSQIIKSHIDIADAINTLTISCEKAVQVCKQQDVNR
ncbi:MAG: hypothetical protein LBF15_01925 [Candidatus Peribacteria bacterium]|jgi:hypothetical protein|nr:hypothetical protein [Candidatus Peribacteria bacterium]